MQARFGDFTFDTDRRSLRRGKTPVGLTPKAAMLLATLVEAAPEAVSKEVLYERLWPGVFVEAGNLHNLVNEVRSAIGDDDHEVVRTVHRVGYAFTAPITRQASSTPRLLIGNDVIELPEGETVIGRALVGTPDVSRHHARINVAGTSVTLEDLDSKNGTFVRGERVRRKMQLKDGDEIVFGRTKATLRLVDTAAATVTARPLTGSRG